jgi:hypothetical protein
MIVDSGRACQQSGQQLPPRHTATMWPVVRHWSSKRVSAPWPIPTRPEVRQASIGSQHDTRPSKPPRTPLRLTQRRTTRCEAARSAPSRRRHVDATETVRPHTAGTPRTEATAAARHRRSEARCTRKDKPPTEHIRLSAGGPKSGARIEPDPRPRGRIVPYVSRSH